MRWLPVGLVVLANVVYHLGQKSIPRTAHPVVAALAIYAVAGVAGLALLPFVPPRPDRASVLASVHWSVALVGLSIVGIEIGFLLAYRWGWQLSVVSLTAMVALALILLPIGVLVFRETLSPIRIFGFALCVVGLLLMGRR